jgi:hypothetical protein
MKILTALIGEKANQKLRTTIQPKMKMHKKKLRQLALSILFVALGAAAQWMSGADWIVLAQDTSAGASQAETETIQDFLARLTPQQKVQFDDGMRAFGAKDYAAALANYKLLLNQLPSDSFLSKCASEAALNVGETSFAVRTLKPVAETNQRDWQAAALLTRACAESGDVPCRNDGISHMLDLHKGGFVPIQQFIIEDVKVAENHMKIWFSLIPWGPYRVYVFGQVLDAGGKIFMRVTLESGDADQKPEIRDSQQTSERLRRFSLDAYRDTGLNSDGKMTQTHYTYKFFNGQPSYDSVRSEFIDIVSGKSTAVSSRTNLVVP